MTQRSSLDQRKAEVRAKVMAGVANKAFSKKNSGLDRFAKALINRTTPPVPHDPELDHAEN
jgi:hypothetical protein